MRLLCRSRESGSSKVQILSLAAGSEKTTQGRKQKLTAIDEHGKLKMNGNGTAKIHEVDGNGQTDTAKIDEPIQNETPIDQSEIKAVSLGILQAEKIDQLGI